MKPFFTQAPGQQRQIFFIGLIHQQVDGVVYSNACYIGTADGAPHPVVEFGPVFKLTRHPQQQMVRHFFFLQGTGCSQLLRKHSRTQQAGAGQIPVFPHGALVLKSAHQCRFHQSAEDAEQVLVIQGHLLFVGRIQADQYHKAAVLPLQKNKLGALASEIHADLAKYFPVDYDETGSIGKRYRRQDEIGTPFTICVDFDTEATQSVTVRDRDTMLQERVALKDLRSYIEERMRF